LVRLNVDIITSEQAVKQATAVIPIVFTATADPVGTSLVTSLARPGGNVTGLSIQSPDTAGKRLERLREWSRLWAGWRSWRTSLAPAGCWSCATFKRQPRPSLST
jgi:ABC transporter substrate binding protein